jgi:DNA-binding SARP family transcriptional activator
MKRVRLRILGECLIEVGDWTLEPSASHLFALLLYLCVERDKSLLRSAIAECLFPDSRLSAATHNLRQLIYRLRQKGAPLVCTDATIILPSLEVSGAPEDLLAQSYSEAVSRSSSHVLLPGYVPPTSALSTWLENYREGLAHKLQARLAQDLNRARQGADWTAVKGFAQALREIDPLNETAALGLAEAMARAGSKQKAVKLLHDYARDVGDESERLTLPSKFLTRRISEDATRAPAGTIQIIGRTAELTRLTTGWIQAKSGSCSLACVTGEKLIGKSRVIEELAAIIRLDGTGTVLALRPLARDRDRPMSLFSDICRQLLELPGAAGCSPNSLSYLRRLIKAPADPSTQAVADDEAIVFETCTRKAIIDLLESVSSERAVLVCIDDAHHLDSASLQLLITLPALAPSTPVYFVLASSPGTSRLLDQRGGLRLAPLSPSNSYQLAEAFSATGGRVLAPTTLDWCVSAASGNPGHLELLVEHVTGLSSTPSVPPSLLAILDEKVQSLAPAARHVLQACVVFGADCSAETVSSLTGLDGYELLAVLERLVLDGFVTDSERGIACRSSLLADRVADTTSRAVKGLLNRRAAQYLEGLVDKLPSQETAWRIADHWNAAGDRARALQWNRVCWRQLISIGQPVAAAAGIRAALESCKELTERAYVLDDLAAALRHASDTTSQLSVLEERSALSDRIGDSDSTRLALAADIAEARFNSYDDTTKLVSGLRSLLRAPALDAERRFRTARVLIVTADSLVSESLAREAVEAVLQAGPTASSSPSALEVQTIFHATFGNPSEATELADLLHAAASQQEFSPARVVSHLTAALAHRIVDVRPLETHLFEQLFERSVAASMIGIAIRVAARCGSMLHEDGEIENAALWCGRARELIERSGIQRLSTDYLTLRIDLALSEGDIPAARRLIDIAPIHFPMYASPKWASAYHSYQTRVEQYEGYPRLAAERLDRMVQWYRTASRLGRYDDHMAVLWTSLRAAGRPEQASEILLKYMREDRREPRPCIYALRTATAVDPAWRALHANGEMSPLTGCISEASAGEREAVLPSVRSSTVGSPSGFI